MQYSVVSYSKICVDSNCFRLDAEFFKNEYLTLHNNLKKLNYKLLKDIDAKIYHPKEIKRKYVRNDGVLFFRAQNVRPLNIDLESNQVFISKEDALLLKNNKIEKEDILITRTGANFGQCAIYLSNTESIASSHTFIVRTKKINPYYITVFFNTIYGRKLIGKGMYGAAQPEIAPFYLYDIPIPIFNYLTEQIEKVYKKSEILRFNSKEQYQQAQTILLSELDLTNWQPKHQLTFVKNYSDTEQAGRIDAEYFQPKYEEIVKTIRNYSGGWNMLGDLVTVKKCVEVGSGEYRDEGIPFVRVSNINPFEITEEKYISEKLYQEIKQHQPQKGEILFSKDATPGIAYYLNYTPQKMIPSGGILRLKSNSDKINNEYLTLVLNSILVKKQVNRDVGGSVILHWRPDQVKETVIPILPEEIQTEIQQKVTESFHLRKQSKHLLECAKKAVEMAIEQDEQKAINWLKEQSGMN